jgi:hypothetical protein
MALLLWSGNFLGITRGIGSAAGSEATVITLDQIIAVLDSLKSLGPLNAQQLDTLATARAAVVGLAQPTKSS